MLLSLCAVEHANIFKALLESNKFLKSVDISERRRNATFNELYRLLGNCSLEILRQLLVMFSNCSRLRMCLRSTESQIVSKDDVREICGVLPCLGVDMTIFLGRHVIYDRKSKFQ